MGPFLLALRFLVLILFFFKTRIRNTCFLNSLPERNKKSRGNWNIRIHQFAMQLLYVTVLFISPISLRSCKFCAEFSFFFGFCFCFGPWLWSRSRKKDFVITGDLIPFGGNCFSWHDQSHCRIGKLASSLFGFTK